MREYRSLDKGKGLGQEVPVYRQAGVWSNGKGEDKGFKTNDVTH